MLRLTGGGEPTN